jgi:hypothetical protein
LWSPPSRHRLCPTRARCMRMSYCDEQRDESQRDCAACPEQRREGYASQRHSVSDCRAQVGRSKYLMSLRRALRQGSGQAHVHESPWESLRPVPCHCERPTEARQSHPTCDSRLLRRCAPRNDKRGGAFGAMTPGDVRGTYRRVHGVQQAAPLQPLILAFSQVGRRGVATGGVIYCRYEDRIR